MSFKGVKEFPDFSMSANADSSVVTATSARGRLANFLA